MRTITELTIFKYNQISDPPSQNKTLPTSI